MTLIDKACFERGCACYDSRDKGECVEITEKREWVGLTDVIITQVIDSMPKKMKGFMVDWDLYEFAQAIEAAHDHKE